MISIRKSKCAIPGLLDLIAYINQKTKGKFKNFAMVEVGSFVGDAAKIWAKHARQVYCVDPWMNGYDEKDPSSYIWPMSQVEAQFDEVLKANKNIIKHKMTSIEAAELYQDESIDMVYIDGNHLYEFVKADILAWSPKVKKGGWICGHDYNHKLCPGTKPAIHETIGKPEKTFQDTSWCKRK